MTWDGVMSDENWFDALEELGNPPETIADVHPTLSEQTTPHRKFVNLASHSLTLQHYWRKDRISRSLKKSLAML